MIPTHSDHSHANESAQAIPYSALRSCFAPGDDVSVVGVVDAFGAYSLEDEILIARLASRDQSALGALFDRFSDEVHAVVVQIVGNETEAEEVVEEVFWKAWERSGAYERNRFSPCVWMRELAREQSSDALRMSRSSYAETTARSRL